MTAGESRLIAEKRERESRERGYRFFFSFPFFVLMIAEKNKKNEI